MSSRVDDLESEVVDCSSVPPPGHSAHRKYATWLDASLVWDKLSVFRVAFLLAMNLTQRWRSILTDEDF